jgi:protein-S-isoprenylcysteine O-methyltransferase Ste14
VLIYRQNFSQEAQVPDSLDFILRFAVFAVLHSLLASNCIKLQLSNILGHAMRYYRLFYNLLSVILFGWVMMAWSSTTVLYVAPGIWSLVMYALQLLLLIILAACLRQTGMSSFIGTDLGVTTKETKLVTSGCYSIVRHPLYLFSLAFFVLNPVMTTRWLTLTLLSVIYFIIGARIEEKRMVESFGSQYIRYQEQIPFIIPDFKKKQNY